MTTSQVSPVAGDHDRVIAEEINRAELRLVLSTLESLLDRVQSQTIRTDLVAAYRSLASIHLQRTRQDRETAA